MKEFNWIEYTSLILAIVALFITLRNLLLRKRINNKLEEKIAKSDLEKSIEKMISIRNANAHNKKRELTEKELNSLILRFEILSKELKENELKHFETTWSYKNQRDRINYLSKLINESNENAKFKSIEKIK